MFFSCFSLHDFASAYQISSTLHGTTAGGVITSCPFSEGFANQF